MRHLPISFRPLITVLASMPWKGMCGSQGRSTGLGNGLCPSCVDTLLEKKAFMGFDTDKTKAGDDSKGVDSPNYTANDAVYDAFRVSDASGLLSQSDYQRILGDLQPKDRYEFNIGLTKTQTRIRTSAVNIVDREEPMVRGLGDAGTVNPTSLWSVSPDIPRDDLNTDPDGTTELDFGKRRRTEGSSEVDEKESEIGFNLTNLTVAKRAQYEAEGLVAVSQEEMIRLLNKGVGLEYSQQLRYYTYADTLRVHARNALAEEFEDHADDERKHASTLARRIVALGGTLEYKVEAPTVISPTDSDAVEKILAELWKREQSGLEYYIDLRDACGQSALRHTVEDILVKELEHNDDLLRLGHIAKEAGAFVPGPKEPFPSQPKMSVDRYHSINHFEDLQKMGDSSKC